VDDLTINTISFGLIIVDVNGKILFTNDTLKYLLKLETEIYEKANIKQLLPSSTIVDVIKNGYDIHSNYDSDNQLYLLEIPDVNRRGVILLFDKLSKGLNFSFFEEKESLKNELETLMNLSGEIVTITDQRGKVLRVSKESERMLGIKPNEYIGKSVIELHKEGFFKPATTKQVLQTEEMVTVTQETKAGKRFVLRSHPMFDNQGKIRKVIHIGKDVTEKNKLRRSLMDVETLANYLQSELNHLKKSDDEMIVKSKVMEDVYSLVSRIAIVDATVLILGESGVGKEIVARKIHELSYRKEKPFIKVNCGAIPESLIESELFGYAKGTFTGASEEGRQGLIKAADGGTLFLDEIGELSLDLQVKLLQVLQDKQVTPLGESNPTDVDVRFIAATNRNLENMVKEGTFRKDLYYRLNVVPITVPPLRERKEDIPFFINYFLNGYNKEYGKRKKFDQEVIQLFSKKNWDGNVRELQNTIERLVVTTSENIIKMEHLPPDIFENPFATEMNGQSLKERVEAFEKSILKNEINSSDTLKEVSEKLSVDVSTISRKAKKYNIDIV